VRLATDVELDVKDVLFRPTHPSRNGPVLAANVGGVSIFASADELARFGLCHGRVKRSSVKGVADRRAPSIGKAFLRMTPPVKTPFGN